MGNEKKNRISAKTGGNIVVQCMLKDEALSQVGDLVKKVEDFLPKYLVHIMNINYQFVVLTKKKQNLTDREILFTTTSLKIIHVNMPQNHKLYIMEPQDNKLVYIQAVSYTHLDVYKRQG